MRGNKTLSPLLAFLLTIFILTIATGILISANLNPASAQSSLFDFIGSPDISPTDGARIYATYVNRGVNTATVEWRTNPSTKGRLEYADESGVWESTPWQDNYTQEHRITLLSLKPNTSYIYRINAETVTGNLETKRGTFNTLSTDILGAQNTGTDPNTAASATNSFQALLSPVPSQAASLTYPNSSDPYNTYYNSPSVGSQTTYPAAPYIQNIYPYQPAVLGQNTQTPEATPTPQPSPTPAGLIAALAATNSSVNLIIGILFGISLAFLVREIGLKRNNQLEKTTVSNQPGNRETSDEANYSNAEAPSRNNKFTFGIGSSEKLTG